MVIVYLCTALAVAICCPQTPVGKLLRYWLIEEPARRLADFKLIKVIGFVVFCLAVIAVAQAFPPELAFLSAMDASAFTEMMVAAALLAAHLNARNLLRRLRSAAIAAALWASSRARSIGQPRRGFARAPSRLRSKSRTPAADDDGGPVFAFA
jgi:hypothetical protein